VRITVKYHISQTSSWPETYQADTLSKGRIEGKEDIHGRVEPLCPPLIGGSELTEPLDLLFEHGENVVRRVACLELGDEWMCCEVILCAFLVCFEGIIENELEVGGRYGSSVKVEHDPGAKRSLVSRKQ